MSKGTVNKGMTDILASKTVYRQFFSGIAEVLESARQTSARTINAIITATYWEVGRRIVEFEQKGRKRAAYGEEVLERLSVDLGKRFGRGFSRQNLQQMRYFYTLYPSETICQTVSGELERPSKELICQTSSGILQIPSANLNLAKIAGRFPLPWSAYVRLLAVKNEQARHFYETEALRGGWSVRQLDRQIESQFYERTALSRNKTAMLTKGRKKAPGDEVVPEEAIKDPYVLEFLNLRAHVQKFL